MDFDILGCSFQMASYIDIPSFEEAFDTESLKRFYQQQAPPVNLNKSLQNHDEDDAWFQSLDMFSPSSSAKNDAQYFFDFPIENVGTQEAQPAKTDKIEQNTTIINKEPTSDLIANICQQIQQFYNPEASAQKEQDTERGEFTFQRKSQADQALGSSILKKIIKKEDIFIIHKRKHKMSSPLSGKSSSPTLQKRISINSSNKSVSDCETSYTNDAAEKPKTSQKIILSGLSTEVKNLIPHPTQSFF